MAIAFDNSTPQSGVGTVSHTCTGSDLIMIVGVFGNTGDGTVTGITYNGVALTQAVAQNLPVGTQYVRLYYLVNPTTGANDVVISGTDPFAAIIISSYTGAKQTGQPDATISNTATGATTVSATLTTVADNSWAVAMVRSTVAGEANNGGVAGTNRESGLSNNYWDSNGALTPAGGKTLSYISGSSNWALAGLSIAPAGGGGGATKFLSLLGVGS